LATEETQNMLSAIYQLYEELLAEVDREFDRVRSIFSERMQCRKGCSSCCSQLFSISAVEAAYISKAAKQFGPQEREDMRRKARAYLSELIGSEVDETQSIDEHTRIIKSALDRLVGVHHIPCPALKNDACTIYDHRPIIARKYGIPLWNPKRPNILQACELNFKPGEVIEADGLVEPQVELEYRWLALKTSVHEELDLPEVVATVASAILFDYEALLEEKIARKTG
jgi:Fe-S-cluster containining protein